jgi:RNA polymerase sporulation-specific sigma factor
MLSKEQIQLIEDNIELVFFCIRKNHLSPEEYLDVGLYGLCKASKTFKDGLGWAFSTYAIKCINNELYLSQRVSYRNKQRFGETRSFDEVVHYNSDGDHILLGDTIPSKTTYMKELFLKDYEKFITNIENSIHKEILYGFYTGESQTELSKRLNINQPTISRIISRLNKKFINTYYKGVTLDDILKED